MGKICPGFKTKKVKKGKLASKRKGERKQARKYKEIKESQKATDGSRNKKKQHKEQRAKGQGLNADFRSRRAAENRRRPFGRDKKENTAKFKRLLHK